MGITGIIRQILHFEADLPPGPEPKPELKGDDRTFRVWLDTNQYQQDMAATVQGSEVCVRCFLRKFSRKLTVVIKSSKDINK